MTKIFCLFSVQNEYDQPDHNLVCWWSEKPSFDALAKAIGLGGFPCAEDCLTLFVVNLWQGRGGQIRAGGTSYSLEEIEEGKVI
jgi:hypothetical protein